MTIEIPPDIPQCAVFAAAGQIFPRMDEDRMRVVHALLLEAMKESEQAPSNSNRLITQLEKAGESQTITTAMMSGRQLHQGWNTLCKGTGEPASHVEQAADDGMYTKVLIITALSQLVAQVSLAVLFPPAAVAADLRAFAAARVAVRRAIEWSVTRLGGRVGGAAQGALPDAVDQLYQTSTGHRQSIDLGSVGTNALAGVAGGPAGYGVGKQLMPVLSRADQRYVAKLWILRRGIERCCLYLLDHLPEDAAGRRFCWAPNYAEGMVV